jgi:phage gp45-like
MDGENNIYTYGDKINIVGATSVNVDSKTIKLYATNDCEIKVKGSCKITSSGTTNINNHLTISGTVS